VFPQRDYNGRVGPPRCLECNAPLGSDEAALVLHGSIDLGSAEFLCSDCLAAGDPSDLLAARPTRTSP